MSNRGLALVRLLGSLEDNSPDQVVAVLGIVARYRLTEVGEGYLGARAFFTL